MSEGRYTPDCGVHIDCVDVKAQRMLLNMKVKQGDYAGAIMVASQVA